MANHLLPTLTSTYTNFLSEVGSRIDDAVKQGRSDTVTLTNPPVGTIRWNTSSLIWEQNTGTVATPVWTALTATYGISISGDAGSVDGKSFGAFSAAGGVVYATSTTAAAATAAGTAGQALLSGAAGAPTWGTLAATAGGTGQTTYAVGDLLYASTTSAVSKLADVATGNALISGGVGVAPSYGKIGLTTHVSGTLPIANGGTNSTATPTNGGSAYGTGTAVAYTAAGLAGQALVSAGAAAPAWTTLTLENLPDAWAKRACKASTTADLAAASATASTITGTLVSFPAQDGITISVGERLLVKNQTTTAQNGIYTLTVAGSAGVTAWVLTRAADANTSAYIAGAMVAVDQGTTNGGRTFDTDFKSTDTLGTTGMTWAQMVDTSYTIPATQGGTGQTSYAVGDLIYASSTTAMSKLADVATGNALISGGVGVAPSYGKIGLTTHISGTLASGNGGTGLTAFTSGGAVYATSTSALTTGTLPIASGGTGAITAGAALVALGERTAATGALLTPVGTTAERPTPATGHFRFNSTLAQFEGYNGSAWGKVGGGATGGGTDDVFIENGQTVNTNYTITTNKNAVSAGPITIASGITVTVPSGSNWAIV
jgi:hypothetical protein